MKEGLCPYHWKPCIKEQCMAWSKKEDLEEIKKNNPEGFESLVSVLMIQEGYSRNAALDVIEIRNNNERCRIIYPDQPI